jgi:GH15 family glucan-1,4-alpha-glucosidase
VLAEQGETEEANRCLRWIAEHADAVGRLPEQVPAALHDEGAYRGWIGRWGEPAIRCCGRTPRF